MSVEYDTHTHLIGGQAQATVDDEIVPYCVVLADAPFNHRSNSVAKPGRNPRRHYKCLTIPELCTLGPKLLKVVADDAVLFMCVPGPQLVIGAHIPLMRAWGFKPTAMGFVWVKLNPRADPAQFTLADLSMGPGHTTRKNAEYVVIGKRGKSLRRDCGVHEIIIAPRREHSRKPDELYRRIEQYVGGESGGPFLELFARESRPAWATWGDEVTKFDAPQPTPGGIQ